jgi:hypothetical protein
MDDWTSEQVLAMLEGGNGQLTNFFDRHHMERTSEVAAQRYHTKAALFYRTHLSKHVAVVAKSGSYRGREESRKHYYAKRQKQQQQQQHKSERRVKDAVPENHLAKHGRETLRAH